MIFSKLLGILNKIRECTTHQRKCYEMSSVSWQNPAYDSIIIHANKSSELSDVVKELKDYNDEIENTIHKIKLRWLM